MPKEVFCIFPCLLIWTQGMFFTPSLCHPHPSTQIHTVKTDIPWDKPGCLGSSLGRGETQTRVGGEERGWGGGARQQPGNKRWLLPATPRPEASGWACELASWEGLWVVCRKTGAKIIFCGSDLNAQSFHIQRRDPLSSHTF